MKKFKIYFGRNKKTSDYLDVFLYPDKQSYYNQRKDRCNDNLDTAASTFIKTKSDGKNAGYIMFDESCFGPAIMAHEFQHAAIHYWRFHKNKKINEVLKFEEDFCDLIAWLFHHANIELSKIYK